MPFKILHLEDSETQRIVVQSELELRGYLVRSPGSISEARSLFENEGDTFDVVILDMNLNGYEDCQGESGVRLAVEYLRANRRLPRPEFLVLSAYQTIEAMTTALQLGIAAYLSKNEASLECLISHVRVLALRHALSNARSGFAKDVDSIILTSSDEIDALLKFSRDRLVPAMNSSLGLPFFLLLTKQNTEELDRRVETVYIGGSTGWPTVSSYYDVLQGFAYGNANDPKPVPILEGLLPAAVAPRDQEVYERLKDGALIPIALSNDLLLSIFLAETNQSSAVRESPAELGPIITQYFRSFILSTLLEIVVKARERSVRQKTILTETARFCLLLGQQQKESIKEMAALDSENPMAFTKTLTKLRSTAEELYRTGTLLKELTESGSTSTDGSVSLLEVTQDVWNELKRLEITERTSLRLPASDCSINMAKDDLWLLLITLFQWFGQRRDTTPENVEQEIKVNCCHDGNMVQLVLEDCSTKLFTPLRARLFEPWMITSSNVKEAEAISTHGLSFAMYLAKAIVEFKYGGQLLDSSDEIHGELGHRFVVSLPIRKQQN